jgi:outer membrane protein assembly factor BamE
MKVFPARGLVMALVLALSGCSWMEVYRLEIQQGNVEDQAVVSKLSRGMTMDQVRFLLGAPLLTDPFHAERWDYVFWRGRAGIAQPQPRRLTLFFVEGKLDRIEGDVVAAQTAGAGPAPEVAPAPASATATAPAGPAVSGGN